jgi:predicted alpha/beta superfamily hydrolase
MGALISLYTISQYPESFGGGLFFSPAFWVSPELYLAIEKFNPTNAPKLYFYAGGKESTTMLVDMKKMTDLLDKKQNIQIRKVVSPLGQHNESYWRTEFADAWTWLFKD